MLKGNWTGVSSQLISRRRLIVNPNQAHLLSCSRAVRLERRRLKWEQSPLIKPQIPQIRGVFNRGHLSKGCRDSASCKMML